MSQTPSGIGVEVGEETLKQFRYALFITPTLFRLKDPVPDYSKLMAFRCLILFWATANAEKADDLQQFLETYLGLPTSDEILQRLAYPDQHPAERFGVVGVTRLESSPVIAARTATEMLLTGSHDHEHYLYDESFYELEDINTYPVLCKNLTSDILEVPNRVWGRDTFLRHFSSGMHHNWSFWRDWYQGFLDGKPLDWELQRRVALIPDEDWQKGPEHIARKIEEIKAGWLAEQAPSAEKIEFDEDTQKFHVIPLEIAKPDLLGATLTEIEDALDDVLACPSNGLHDGSKAVRVLRRTLTIYGNNPQQIEMGLVTAHTAITRQFLSDEMPQSEENLALRDAIEVGARGIRATHPEVAENRKILKEQALREMSQEDLDLLEDAKPMLEEWSSDDLAEDWAHDIPQLINDAVTPLPSGAPPLPGAEEATRIFSRAAKMKLSYDAIVSNGASVFDSKTMKTVRLGLTFSGLLSALVGVGLRLFGLI